MGRYEQTIIGIGKNREEAEAEAIEQFYFENGNVLHRVREVLDARYISKAPNDPLLEMWVFVLGYNA